LSWLIHTSTVSYDHDSVGLLLTPKGRFHKRNNVVTRVEWVTATVEDTIVYLDENGVPTSTGYDRAQAEPTPAVIDVPSNSPAEILAVPTEPAAIDIPQYAKKPQVPVPVPAPIPAPVQQQQAVARPIVAARPPVLQETSENEEVEEEPRYQVIAPQPQAIAPQPQVAAPRPELSAKFATVAAGLEKTDGYGVSWTPFNGEEEEVTCKPQAQADAEFQKMARMQFTSVRMYGTDCDQVSLSMRAAGTAGLKVMLGVFNLNDVERETQDLIRQVQESGQGWDMVETISIGNEDVQKGTANAQQVIAAVNTARGILKGAGYQGPVVHVETHGAILANPELCSEAAGDYVAANIHPFFNPLILSYFAGKYVRSQVEALQACSAHNSKKRSEHRVVVTETGWPTSGWPNGLAIPSRGQQFAAIKSIKKELAGDVYLFSAFDNHWQRDNPTTFGAEKHWGLLMDEDNDEL
jgi:exo-beta-1,3-glucanase (GH17 family)